MNEEAAASHPTTNMLRGMNYDVSVDLMKKYITSLSNEDIIKILNPVKARLLSEDTVLHINTLNFSIDHDSTPLTVREVLALLGPVWQRWIHNAASLVPPGTSESEMHEHIRIGAFESIDVPPTDFVRTFIEGLTKKQKRAILLLTRDGLLTDESFLNVCTYTGPDRVQVSMKKVVDILAEREARNLEAVNQRILLLRFLFMQHYSSASFENMKKTDLDVSCLRSGRQKMSIWYTVAFTLMTVGTLASHVWSNATNFETMRSQFDLTIAILVLASLAIGALVYLVTYMVGFLCCCESSLPKSGLTRFTSPRKRGKLIDWFSTLHHFEIRIIATKVLQFILLWYTILLAIYAHENDLNIYPALLCVVTNGFGLMLFARIAHFFHACRVSKDGKILYAL